MLVCTATVRRTPMGHTPPLFEITRVPVTKKNVFHRRWWFDLLLSKPSARIQRRQSRSHHLLPFLSQHHHWRRVTCRLVLARGCPMSSVFPESSAFRSTSASR